MPVDGEDYWAASEARRAEIGRRFGVLFQSGALWSSMTVAENVALPLQMFTTLAPAGSSSRRAQALASSGLPAAAGKMPSELSGGMRKRAGLARALALDPDMLFFDEPSAGLDPITSKRLDELILELSEGFGATVVIVSHELPSPVAICDDGVFLDAETKTAIAHGSPRALRDTCDTRRCAPSWNLNNCPPRRARRHSDGRQASHCRRLHPRRSWPCRGRPFFSSVACGFSRRHRES